MDESRTTLIHPFSNTELAIAAGIDLGVLELKIDAGDIVRKGNLR
jgi:hypothetical protein